MSRAPTTPLIGSLTRLVWQWVRKEIHTAVVSAGYDDLNPAHIDIFRNPTPDGRRPSELAEEMQITKQSVNELLGQLERRAYLVREPDPHDNRSRRIRLTARGQELQEVTWQAARRAERTAASLIGDDRMTELRQILHELTSQLGLLGGGSGLGDSEVTVG